MKKPRSRLTYANVISSLALFLVLAGGTALAASHVLPKNSVGAKQLKQGAVTPTKLSRATKSTIRGATGQQGPEGERGPQGPAGPQGMEGVRGMEGVQGPHGTTGNEPFAVDASVVIADVKAQGTETNAPLVGTSTFTTTAGQAGLLLGKLDATLALEPGGSPFNCGIAFQVYVDGTRVGFLEAETSEAVPTKVSNRLAPVAVAIHEPGLHTVTATFFGGTKCLAGSKVESLDLVVAPLGR
jgi:hypothetical protein